MALRWSFHFVCAVICVFCCAAGLEGCAASAPLPFIVLHGIGDQCRNDGIAEFTQRLSDMSGAQGNCIAIGNGWSDSYLIPINKQAALVCNMVKSMPSLRHGYNIVGLSQGNMVARTVVELCHGGPPVHNYVSLGGPHAGIAAIPYCRFMFVCRFLNKVIAPILYSRFVQNHLAPSGYFKIPTHLQRYYRHASLLPLINNEISHVRNEIFKKRLCSLKHLVLIKFEEDLVVIPPQSAWFEFYADNDFGHRVPTLNETDLYKEDWIGLRSLNEEGKVTFISFPGDHLSISEYQMERYIVPYLNQTSCVNGEELVAGTSKGEERVAATQVVTV